MTEYAVMPLADYVNSCDKIREKTETTENIKSGEMPGKIDEVYEAGKKAEYDEFWMKAVPDPSYTDGTGAFAGQAWNDNTFCPPNKISIRKNCNYAFYNCGVTDITPYVVFENTTALTSTFQYSNVKKIPVLDASNVGSMTFTFGSSKVESVELLIVSENTKYVNTFQLSSELVNLTIDGTIGQNGFDVHWSTKLSKESITSIVNAISTTTTGLSVTLSLTAVNKAFETSEGANDGITSTEWISLVSTKSNWTISLA